MANSLLMRVSIYLVLFFLSGSLMAQTRRIDSIKNQLTLLSGTALADNYNQLGHEYHFYWVHSDSCFKYARLALEQSTRFRYAKGQVSALLTMAGVEGRLLGHPLKMEEHITAAFKVLEKNNDPALHSAAEYYRSVNYSILGKYQQAHPSAARAKQFALKANNKQLLGWAEQAIAFVHFKSGEYWKSFPHLVEAQQLGKEVNDSVLTTLSLAIIARSFSIAGDPVKALSYHHQSLQYAVPFIHLWSHYEDMAFAHIQLKQFDSASYYQRLNARQLLSATTDKIVRDKFLAFSFGYSITIQLANQQYDSVLKLALPRIDNLRQTRDIVPFMQSLMVIGKAYEAKGNDQLALQYARELYKEASQVSNLRLLKDANELLADIFTNLGKSDSALVYYKQFTVLKDSMEMAQYAGRTALYLAASEAENKIRLLSKDNEISRHQLALNKKELQKQSQLKNGFIAGTVMLLLLSFLIFRNITLKRRNEKLRNDQVQSGLKRKALELEMQALRAQINPHFIFNCLSAIDNLIQTNQTETATLCLSRFAKLIRGVLDSSKSNLVPFYKDFETLKLYLELEQFRCNDKFSYEIKADDKLLDGGFKVPPMLIQPFVENAILHGLLNKEEGNRRLDIKAELEEDYIVYTVWDNGIGRKLAAQIKAKNKPEQVSYGIEITKERIQLHNRNGIDKDLVITDLEESGQPKGTKAVIRIHH